MSIDFPEKCCEIGSYKCQIPMPLRGRRNDVDICIADLVAALNAANIITAASCCGHSKFIGSIILDDGRVLDIWPNQKEWEKHYKKVTKYPKANLRRKNP